LAPVRHPGPNTTVLAALAIGVAMAATGCGSSSDETGTGETTAPPASTSTTPGKGPIGVRAKGCGAAGSSGAVRVTGVSCELGRSLVSRWHKNRGCAASQGASRLSCRLGRFVCLGAATDRGVAVTCAAPGRSVAFVAREPS
jgi:hypothetical protein